MEHKIIKEEKNPFLGRTEYDLEIVSEAVPSAEEVKGLLGKDIDLTVVKKVNTNFGKQTFVAEVVVYDDAEHKEKVEVIPKKVKKKMEAERKKAEEEAKKKAEEEAKAAAEAVKAEEETTEETSE